MFDGTLLIRQRTITTYRAQLFGMLAQRCKKLVVVAGRPSEHEGIAISNSIEPGSIVPVKNVEIGRGTFLVYWQQDLLKHVEQINPDVIVTEANPRFTDTGKMVRWARKRNRPVLGWGLGTTNFFNRIFPRIRAWKQRRTFALFNAMISYSELARDQYIEAGFPSDKIFVAHNATIGRRPMPQRTVNLDRPFQVVTFGRLVAHKNIELLINAVAQLKRQGCDVELHIIGDGPHRSNLEALVQKSQINGVFHGMQNGEDLARLASECDLFVLPGLGGLAIQEAMAFGLPLIVSEADGTELDLVRETNGWRIEPDNVSALAQTIGYAATHREESFQMGIESYQIFDREINLETMADKFLNAVVTTAAAHALLPQ